MLRMIDFMTLKQKTSEDLRRLLDEHRARLADLRFQLRARELKNVHELRATRRTIARILTILHQGSQHGDAGTAVRTTT